MGNKVFTALVVVAACAGAFLFSCTGKLEKETAGIVVADISAISEKWDAATLKSLADPGLIKAMGSQGQSAEELLKIYSALGKLKQPAECKFHATQVFMKGGVEHTTVSYDCAATYDKGEAAISITLIKGEGETKWLIYYINIHSDIFGGGDIIE